MINTTPTPSGEPGEGQTLDEYRAALFFEQRLWRGLSGGRPPVRPAYIEHLLEKIRELSGGQVPVDAEGLEGRDNLAGVDDSQVPLRDPSGEAFAELAAEAVQRLLVRPDAESLLRGFASGDVAFVLDTTGLEARQRAAPHGSPN